MSSDFECPYCGADQEVNHDDGAGYEEDVLHEQCCSECDKYYTFTTGIIYVHEAFQADCLNDGNHLWRPSRTWPKEFSRMVCDTCDHTRSCTEEEMKSILSNDK